ncbi:MAG: ATP-dependent 6-phosphofructokinase [Deltaproteobacteria bacterium]|nr:MAG: ATP-dependent 6-phosphofructokinase [Deltaproteobacteria bacterium]
MKIAVLTGGGDCPGLNAVIRAVVRRGEQLGLEVMGIREGWRGLLDPPQHDRLTREATSGILHLGGTILGTSRTNPFKKEGGAEQVVKNIKSLNLGAIVAIGGEDTLGVATKLHGMGMSIVGVPKTIDNDLYGTDLTFGFDTAVQIATEAIDRLHSTAESHNRVIVCEVMGRHAGWIATYSGIAGGADVILIPERPIDIDRVCEHITRRHKFRDVNFSIVVVAEGAKLGGGGETKVSEKLDEFGHVRLGGIGQQIAELIEKQTGFETRSTVLGHIQRGGTPTAFDRVLATRFGVHAADMVSRKEWGKMASLRGNQIVSVPLAEATAKLKTVDDAFFAVAEVFFG